ncbi:cupin domain-containing protein [Pseudomonas lalucatii]|uniref:Cupin domain-containing protein n=1 Tax=Pseudomonas lalucatii TaxID=1424203 RepID=A0ABS5Q4U8_9PSED|nr:cupin domain-containing protein [Pseudomonas lalucatii]MBS7663727.1 cupin domain-containing protein [Pseudomonas lalucatii]QVM86855.1 cupin domain-containing protein [Pseudomonas lalucatii]
MSPLNRVAATLVLLSGTWLTLETVAEEAALIAAKASELQWSAAPSVGPGAMIAVIEGDPKAAAPFTFRLKLPANSTVGVHTHPTTERVTVLSGSFYLGTGDALDPAKATTYQAGDTLIIPAGMAMSAGTRAEEAVLQLHGTGPWGIAYHDPADDPRNQ